MKSFHQPVMLEQVVHYLKPKPGDNLIDCTLGGGGHTEALFKRILPGGKILGIDLDQLAIATTTEFLKNYKNNVVLAQDNFKNLEQIAETQQFNKVNGILLDLGLSSGQIRDQGRGFSFLAQGPLDMRFGSQSEVTAGNIINTYSQKELYEIFKNFGEEKLAKPISQEIVERRQLMPITEPSQIVEIAAAIYARYYHGQSKMNPATKVFQALRIAVNDELENLRQVLPQAVSLLAKGGRLAVISYHSLEDRIVKEYFKQESIDCICPPQMPQCQCTHKKTLKIITKKPVMGTADEILENPRARSAKLRVAEKI